MEQSLEQAKNDCLAKWGEIDNRLQLFSDNFETWINQIPEENQETVLTLIRNLSYYSHKTTNGFLKELHQRLVLDETITDDNTIYTFIKTKDGHTNSSVCYWCEYQGINGLNSFICIEDTDKIKETEWQSIQNVVFIDDFSGTGKSLIKELRKKPEKYKDKRVILITIAIMQNAIDNILDYCESNGISFSANAIFTEKKAFARKLFADEQKAYKQIEEMSDCLNIPPNEVMGYCNSQALVAFYNNTPNNTLGFIRYDTEEGYHSIFPRKQDKRPDWGQMRRERRNRENANYSSATNGG